MSTSRIEQLFGLVNCFQVAVNIEVVKPETVTEITLTIRLATIAAARQSCRCLLHQFPQRPFRRLNRTNSTVQAEIKARKTNRTRSTRPIRTFSLPFNAFSGMDLLQ